MTIKGTRILQGKDAFQYSQACENFRKYMIEQGCSEIILPNLAYQEIFTEKAGVEILGQMYTFQDKGERDICLIPEATAVVQDMFKTQKISTKTPTKLFYIQRCYRYERPQAGRYREFTQLGVEIIGGKVDREEVLILLRGALNAIAPSLQYRENDSVKRGLSYYIEDGFEFEVDTLGAQKQIAGGGRYNIGIGWGIGLDRVLLAMNPEFGK